ncbi:MAG: DNA repair protein RadA, partial [Candidatus Hydrothermae bacterium]|nr:DNA repair protein RadA [Candidatus Hydrothermae bacterium]
MVDTVLYFEGDSSTRFRVIRAVKNRFGAVNEIGVFAMTDQGLKTVSNPSAIFLAQHDQPVAGSVIMVSREGTRPFLVEIQALVTPTPFPVPQRTVTGFDPKRLAMLLAIADRYLGTELRKLDVFLQVLGGFRIQETAADLAILMALLSAYRRIPLPARTLFLGELDLSGTVRAVPGLDRRLKEAQRVGFTRAYLPPAGKRPRIRGLRIRQVRSFQEVAEDVLA